MLCHKLYIIIPMSRLIPILYPRSACATSGRLAILLRNAETISGAHARTRGRALVYIPRLPRPLLCTDRRVCYAGLLTLLVLGDHQRASELSLSWACA